MNSDAQQVTVGNDLVGRDKIIQANTYIEHATIIQAAPTDEKPAMFLDTPTWGGVEYVHVPAGPFCMGSISGLSSQSASPLHGVELSHEYWFARYPVTNEQFARFVAATSYSFDQGAWQIRSDHPVVKVSWFDALAYCKWLNSLVKTSFPSRELVVRLPTEAEWEKAARGDAKVISHEWPWGDEFDRTKCNTEEGGRKSTTPVGLYSPQGDNAWGVADLIGNVWEWTSSLWGLDLFQPQYRYPYDPHDGREKLDAPASVYRVLRGGSFNSRSASARITARYWFDPRARNESVGFRVVVAPRLK